MKFGVSLFPTHYSIGPAAAARACEDVGLESIWFPEHTHIPTSTRFPMGDGVVPRDYRSTLDPFVALAAAAAVTSRIKLATGILLVPHRDPIVTAKEVATLDVISGGRVILGVGGGWNEPEMSNHGTDFAHRFKVTRERIEAMQAIWTQDEAEYHGETVDFGPMWSDPKPIQKPYPPIHIGGTGPTTLKRVVAYGDGWMPIAFTLGFDELGARIKELNAMASAAGKPKPEVSVFGVPLDVDGIRTYESLGVDRAIWGLSTDGEATALGQIEQYGKAIRAYNS